MVNSFLVFRLSLKELRGTRNPKSNVRKLITLLYGNNLNNTSASKTCKKDGKSSKKRQSFS